jgi:hypothetical protein
MEAITDGNGRVTLALLGERMDTVIGLQKQMIANQGKHDERLSLLERCQDVHGERIKTACDDIGELEKSVDSIKTSDRWGTIGTGIAATIAGIIAIFRP